MENITLTPDSNGNYEIAFTDLQTLAGAKIFSTDTPNQAVYYPTITIGDPVTHQTFEDAKTNLDSQEATLQSQDAGMQADISQNQTVEATIEANKEKEQQGEDAFDAKESQ